MQGHGAGHTSRGGVNGQWSIHPEQEHVSLTCVPSGMGKVGGKEADSRIVVFNSNFVCNPVMFIRETLQGLGRRCILHGQNSLVRVAQLVQALFDPTYALFTYLSTFLYSSPG